MADEPEIKYSDIILYSSPEGNVKVEVFFQDETFWLNQKRIAQLFGVEVNTINYHLKEIFKSGELQEDSVIRKIRITADDKKKYLTNLYNLDSIIAVGYRVNSFQATKFRIWATKTLREFIIKGFVLDDERLKQGKRFGKDYFDELLERIREIRASERRFYPMKMADWVKKLDGFLQFNEYDILKSAGKISHEVAKQLAEKEFEKFRITQDQLYESDFDQEVKRFLKVPKK